MAAKYLIVNADDFGASPGVNRGILEAHRRGIVTSTSLLVGAPASAAAAELARASDRLSVGLHVELDLDDGSIGEPESLALALSRQAERFVALMRRPPTHLDSHRDVHREPRLLPTFLALARRFGVPLRGHSEIRCVSSFYGQWAGAAHPEHVGVASITTILGAQVGDGITEMSCHPGYCDGLTSSYLREREVELATLCDPRVRRAVVDLGIELVSHGDVGRIVGGPR